MAYDLLLERFLRYAKINTRSDENATRTPTTQSQVDFALNILKPELEELGLSNIQYLESNGYLVATLPANDDRLTRKIGFISHMDTADFNAEGVSPQVIESYDGGIIPLGTSGYNLDPADFPNLQNYIGQTLITTDGTTLLGADDKSGIAEIMTALAHLKANPEIKHCEIRVGFGPDEEIGIGADKFDVDDFDVDFAYTVDGGPLGELQYETFSAAGAELIFHGRNVHPGTAKGQMVNALQLAIDFHNQLPAEDRPELTDGYQGFNHIQTMTGTVEEANSSYIIRDFETESFENRKATFQEIADKMNQAYGQTRVDLVIKDQYYNMRQVIEKDMMPVELAKEVMEDLGIVPVIEPIRGGTDGSKISFKGIPTPNIFAGGENMHGRY
ncbi:MAG: peptidase T, partial [Streptococcus thermophilus]|nr:peptidase T [Streptococcus thermophilus]